MATKSQVSENIRGYLKIYRELMNLAEMPTLTASDAFPCLSDKFIVSLDEKEQTFARMIDAFLFPDDFLAILI